MAEASPIRTWLKVCGLTSVANALMVTASDVDAIGLNFVRTSPRYVSPGLALQIRQVIPSGIEVVGVFADASIEELLEVKRKVGLDSLQLHGSEPPAILEELFSLNFPAYKAIRIATSADVAEASAYGGERILVDAKCPGVLGGSGKTFPWSLIEELNSERHMILAGGLTPSNVRDALSLVRPFGVDTASGVESSPGVKEESALRSFVDQVRSI